MTKEEAFKWYNRGAIDFYAGSSGNRTIESVFEVLWTSQYYNPPELLARLNLQSQIDSLKQEVEKLKEAELRAWQLCPKCMGTGLLSSSTTREYSTCDLCYGAKKIKRPS